MIWLIGAGIIGLIGLAAITGIRRGFLVIAGSFLALLLSFAIAGFGYQSLGGVVQKVADITPALANIAAYLALLISLQLVSLLALRFIITKTSRRALPSRFSQIGGAVVAVMQAVLFIAIGLSIVAQLPMSPERKSELTDSPIVHPFIQLGNRLQSLTRTLPSRDFTETLTLLTVDPGSTDTVQLGYTTDRVSVDEEAERQILDLINQERKVRGLPPLTMRQDARLVARSHSQDMFARGYFSHQTPDNKSPFDRMRAANVSFLVAGENLALAPTVDLAHSGLMNSPGHKANILSKNYRQVGVGVIDGGRYGLMVTQNFTD